MCGIAGILSLEKPLNNPFAVKSMCEAIAHRGPDDAGYVLFSLPHPKRGAKGFWFELTDENFKQRNPQLAPIESEYAVKEIEGNRWHLALGHRRLSIIDLTFRAHQPMSDRGKRVWLTYNGEIYNFRELRQELKGLGYPFYSCSDTEVIIYAYQEWNIDCVSRFNGMFAFALWDLEKEELYLVRDRYGVKPLYYTFIDGCLIFSSEVKGIIASGLYKTALNLEGLFEYFTFQNTFGERTLFRGINILEPGHYLKFSIRRKEGEKKRYWDFEFLNEEKKEEIFYVEALREKLKKAVERQLIADVEVGSYLSGGLDSTSITILAAQGKERWKVFTCGFDVSVSDKIERFFDERDKAEVVSSNSNLEHYQMVIHSGDLEWALPRVINQIEDLRVGMCYPHYFMAQLASKFVKVVLSGPGGDELLGGYPWRYKIHTPSRSEFPQRYYEFWCRLISDKEKPNFFQPHIFKEMRDYSSKKRFEEFYYQNPNFDGENISTTKRALYFEAKTFLPGILLLEDKLSMAHSLESRVPFLDNEFVDFATKIPTPYIVNFKLLEEDPRRENWVSKYVLRKAMSGILPKEIIEGRKQGFSAPEKTWYMTRLVDYINKTLLSKDSHLLEFIQPTYIKKVLDEHINKGVNHRLLIWSLLSFEWWNIIFIDGKSQDFSGHCKRRGD